MSGKIIKFIKEEEGTETVEWGILIGLIVVVSLGAIIGIALWVTGTFQTLSTAMGS